MSSELEIRPAREEDEGPILDLMRLSLGEGAVPRSRAYWRWKHEENPFGPSPCLLAVSGDQLVGLRVFMRWTWHLDGRPISSVRAVDTATHPEWRGRGIFTRLTKALLSRVEEEGVSFVFNTPNEKSRPGYLKMGWEDVGRVSLWVRPMRPLRLLRGLRSTDSVAFPGMDEDRGAGRSVRDFGGEPGVEEFLAAAGAPAHRLATPRTMAYLQWRYQDIPGMRYRAVWRVDGPVGACLVFRLRSRGTARELRLCEFLVGPGRASARIARGLVGELVRDSDADFATVMTVTGGRTGPLLAALGFLPVPRMGPILTARLLDSGRSAGLDPTRRSAWHTSIGDLELF